MNDQRAVFTNELGNEIEIRVQEVSTAETPGVLITIVGPTSTATNHLTFREAHVLLAELKAFVNEAS